MIGGRDFYPAEYRYDASAAAAPQKALYMIAKGPAASIIAPEYDGSFLRKSGVSETYYILQMKSWSKVAVVAAIVGIATAIVALEVEYYFGHTTSYFTTIMRGLTSLSTICLLVCLYYYYEAIVGVQRCKHVLAPFESVWWSPYGLWLCAELLVCALHPPIGLLPWAAHYSPESNRSIAIQSLSGLLFLRGYLVVRFIRDHSFLNHRGARFVGMLTRVDFSTTFLIKSILDTYPYSSVILILGSLMVSLSYVVHIMERVDNDEHAAFRNSVWFMMVTMTTVGYGDIYAVTTLGRLTTVIGAFVGVLLTALLVALVHRKMQLSLPESKVVNFLRRDSKRRLVQDVAARCIQSGWRYYYENKVAEPRKQASVRRAERTVYAACRLWRKLKKDLTWSSPSNEEAANLLLDDVWVEVLNLHSDLENIMLFLQSQARGRKPHVLVRTPSLAVVPRDDLYEPHSGRVGGGDAGGVFERVGGDEYELGDGEVSPASGRSVGGGGGGGGASPRVSGSGVGGGSASSPGSTGAMYHPLRSPGGRSSTRSPFAIEAGMDGRVGTPPNVPALQLGRMRASSQPNLAGTLFEEDEDEHNTATAATTRTSTGGVTGGGAPSESESGREISQGSGRDSARSIRVLSKHLSDEALARQRAAAIAAAATGNNNTASTQPRAQIEDYMRKRSQGDYSALSRSGGRPESPMRPPNNSNGGGVGVGGGVGGGGGAVYGTSPRRASVGGYEGTKLNFSPPSSARGGGGGVLDLESSFQRRSRPRRQSLVGSASPAHSPATTGRDIGFVDESVYSGGGGGGGGGGGAEIASLRAQVGRLEAALADADSKRQRDLRELEVRLTNNLSMLFRNTVRRLVSGSGGGSGGVDGLADDMSRVSGNAWTGSAPNLGQRAAEVATTSQATATHTPTPTPTTPARASGAVSAREGGGQRRRPGRERLSLSVQSRGDVSGSYSSDSGSGGGGVQRERSGGVSGSSSSGSGSGGSGGEGSADTTLSASHRTHGGPLGYIRPITPP